MVLVTEKFTKDPNMCESCDFYKEDHTCEIDLLKNVDQENYKVMECHGYYNEVKWRNMEV